MKEEAKLHIFVNFSRAIKAEPIAEVSEETKKRKLEREATPPLNVSGDGIDTQKQKKKKKKKAEGEASTSTDVVKADNAETEETVRI